MAKAAVNIGENVEAALEGAILILRIDLSKLLRKSASGKTTLIATTGGNTEIPEHPGMLLGLNVYTLA